MSRRIKKSSRYPLFSIVIPTCNSANYIRSTIQSVFNQTLDDWEMIISDDGSSDDTVAIIASFSDPRIKVTRVSLGSASANFNNAMSLATGDYIKPLCHDDYLYPNCLELHHEVYRKFRDIDIVTSYEKAFGDRVFLRSSNSFPGKGRVCRFEALKCFLNLEENWIGGPHAVSFKNKPQYRFDASYNCSFDVELWQRILRHSDVYVIPHILYGSRIHKGQLSGACYRGGFSSENARVFTAIKDYFFESLSEEIQLYNKPIRRFRRALRYSFFLRIVKVRKIIKLYVFLRFSFILLAQSFVVGIIRRRKLSIKRIPINSDGYFLAFNIGDFAIEDFVVKINTHDSNDLLPVADTPHFSLAINFLAGKTDEDTNFSYLNYQTTFSVCPEPRAFLQNKFSRLAGFAKSTGEDCAIVVYSNLLSGKPVVFDGAHRLALFKALGYRKINAWAVLRVHHD
ncbi:glycosyltransferase [Alphaproteobacteria bacterium]|nr:glycosyltransferase [Alphaproteobacteria bacterium]